MVGLDMMEYFPSRVANGSEGKSILLSDMDAVAKELQTLRDAKVPILWRPLHEASGGWFWWGDCSPDSYCELYRLMYEKFTKEYELDNLIFAFRGNYRTVSYLVLLSSYAGGLFCAGIMVLCLYLSHRRGYSDLICRNRAGRKITAVFLTTAQVAVCFGQTGLPAYAAASMTQEQAKEIVSTYSITDAVPGYAEYLSAHRTLLIRKRLLRSWPETMCFIWKETKRWLLKYIPIMRAQRGKAYSQRKTAT